MTERLVYTDPIGTPRERASIPEAPYAGARFSPDGARLAFAETSPAPRAIRIHEIRRDVVSRFDVGAHVRSPATVWSPDGASIAFGGGDGTAENPTGIYTRPVNGIGREELLLKGDFVPLDWSSDGQYLLYGAADPANPQLGGGGEIWALPLTGERRPMQIIAKNSSAGRLSHSGRWLAYMSPRGSGTAQIYIRSFPEPREDVPVTSGNAGGQYPVWGAGDARVYYVTNAAQIMSVDVIEKRGALTIGTPRPVFADTTLDVGNGLGRFDVSPDGSRFALFVRQLQHLAPVTLVSNWDAGLKR